MGSFQSVAVEKLLADDRGISVGVMYPGEDTPDGVPLIRVGDIIGNRISSNPGYRISKRVHDEYRRTALLGGECLITLVGRPGVTLVVPPEMRGWNAARALAVVRLKEPEDARFFAYSMSAPAVQNTIENWCNTTVQATLNLKEIRALTVPWPERRDRQRIVEILGSLDEKIELNRRMNETLEAMAQAIFRDWFVDFGPTRRKLYGATDPITIMGGLVQDTERAQALTDLFPAKLGDDGLPEGWTFKPLDESIVLQRGFDLPKSSRTDGLYPVIAASGPSGTHSEFKVSAPGVCTGRSGVLGNVFYVQQNFWPLNTSLWVKAYPNATPIYAYFLLREIDLSALNAGSAVPTLNRNHVHNRPTVTPPMAIVRAYTAIAELLMVKSDQAAKECQILAATRDLLLPKLMSGEIRLSEADDLMEAAQ